MLLLQKKSLVFCCAAVLLIGGFFAGLRYDQRQMNNCQARDYRFLNPDFMCGNPVVISKTSYQGFENTLKKTLEEKRSVGELKRFAVYFRDLRNGPVFGINEREDFVPASLLKLPLAITFLDMKDNGEADLQEKVLYSGSGVVEMQTFKPDSDLQVGQMYSIEKLLEVMIENSDNLAYLVLYNYLALKTGSTGRMMQTYQELGLIDPKDPGAQTLDVRGYASIFRILYNASYLSPECSSKLLGWLAKSNFSKGLKEGIPESIQVADKFGERVADDETKQLHDCGIIYYPGNPYMLCVMTYGDDWTKLEEAIRDVSRLVYDEVDSRRFK
jgi:beta-lactamase class A